MMINVEHYIDIHVVHVWVYVHGCYMSCMWYTCMMYTTCMYECVLHVPWTLNGVTFYMLHECVSNRMKTQTFFYVLIASRLSLSYALLNILSGLFYDQTHRTSVPFSFFVVHFDLQPLLLSTSDFFFLSNTWIFQHRRVFATNKISPAVRAAATHFYACDAWVQCVKVFPFHWCECNPTATK